MLLLLITFTEMGARINTDTGIFNPRYRTITTEINGNRLVPPAITLGSDDRLTIGFDALEEDRDYLRYSIVHCNADWQPSGLVDSEVFDGFNYGDIEDYAFSRGTTVHYVHYTITLPNNDFTFRLSGNYLLRVYPENDPDDILLQVRFLVSEGAVGVGGTATSRTDIGYNDTWQQLEIVVDANSYPIRDMFGDLTLVVNQNNRLDNEVTLSHPSKVLGTRAYYEHLRELIFPAGNEYRRMETVQMTYPGMGVEEIQYHDPYYHHFLQTARPRFASSYSYDSTQHGRFFIREYNSDNSDTEADYSVVHFYLDQGRIPDADVYIDGDLTCRVLDDSSKMTYNPDGYYEKAMLLKQGAYNYQFVTRRPGATKAETAQTEGDFYQTVNEYLVKVYYRAPGERYDRLLGYTLIFSGQ